MKKIIWAIFITSLVFNNNAIAHSDNAYYHGARPIKSQGPWMALLDNDARVMDISIPGTHGSAALYGGPIVQNQTLSISQQLEGGIRFLDIRLRHIDNKLALHHGMVFQKNYFDSILSSIIKYLKENPSEFILVRIKKEHTESGNTRNFSDTMTSYINQGDNRRYIYDGHSPNPYLKDLRGKILFLDNADMGYGIDYNTFDIQDEYTVVTNWDLYDKWQRIKEKLSNPISGSINYLSASTGSFPFFVVSGHVYSDTDSSRLSTGMTTPGWNNTYPDFPRVSCFLWICTIAFEGTNTLTKDYILKHKSKYVGIIATDFPGEGLIEAIINTNKKAKLTVFEHGSFQGNSKLFPESTAQVGYDFNDKISSLKVPAGFYLKAYEHNNFSGKEKTYVGDVDWVGNDFNDKISSLKLVFRKPITIADNNLIRQIYEENDRLSSLLNKHNVLNFKIRNGRWAPSFTLPENAPEYSKISIETSATYSFDIYFNNTSIRLRKGGEAEFIYDSGYWTLIY